MVFVIFEGRIIDEKCKMATMTMTRVIPLNIKLNIVNVDFILYGLMLFLFEVFIFL